MQINWYLKGNAEPEGPFSEPEIRARLLAGAYSPGTEVKQGESAWRPAEEVKQLFIRIYQEGWYVKHRDKTVGPFVTQKLLDLHQSGKLPKKAMVRQGTSNTWTPATEMIQTLHQKQSLLAQLNQTIAQESKTVTTADRDQEVIEDDTREVISSDELEVIEDDELEVIVDGEPIDIEEELVKPIPTRIQLSKPIATARPNPATPMRTLGVLQGSPNITVTTTPATKPSAAIPMAQIVVPGPTLLSNAGDPFRDVPTLQPVAMPSVPSYSHPIAAPSIPRPARRSAVAYTESQTAMFWQWFYWMMFAAVVPRVLLTGLSGIAFYFESQPGMFLIGSVGFLELLACIAVAFALSIWNLIIPFEESIEQGLLCLFIPFYVIFYWISRWDRCWPVVLLIVGHFVWLCSMIFIPLLFAFIFAPR